jgi:hypothetical protein
LSHIKQCESAVSIITLIMFSNLTPLSIQDAKAECQKEIAIPPMSVITERDQYTSYEVITVTGRVRDDLIGINQTVGIEIYATANGELVKSDVTLLSANNGSFAYSLPQINKKNSLDEGEYKVVATYGKYQASWSFRLFNTIADYAPQLVAYSTRVQDLDGKDSVNIRIGQQVILSTTWMNQWETRDRSFVGIFEIRNDQGVTSYLAFQSGFLRPECSTEMGISWLPEEEGHYQVRIFAVTSFDYPLILSTLQTSELSVTSE